MREKGSDLTKDIETEGRPKLLIVTSALYFGGAQKVAYLLASGLAGTFDVTVAYCFDSGRSHAYPDSVRIRRLPSFPPGAGQREKNRVIRAQVRALRALKRELDVDAALSLGKVANWINAMSRGKEKVICSERSNPKKVWGKQFFLTRGILRRADFVVFQSERIREMYGQRVRRKSCILKNPVLRPEAASEERDKEIVTLGRLTPQKNHALLLGAFSRFRALFPEYRLKIFGDGELEAETRQRIRDLDLSDAVTLEKNDPEVHRRIRRAEIFVLSSDYEGMSNALLECMSMGIACISTRCEGSVDMIRDGENGLLVDIGNEAQLAKAMETLARDPDLRHRLGRQAAEDMLAFDAGTVVEDWGRIIRRCL